MQRRISKTQKQEVNWIDEGSCCKDIRKAFICQNTGSKNYIRCVVQTETITRAALITSNNRSMQNYRIYR
jgi:hypothetical protein